MFEELLTESIAVVKTDGRKFARKAIVNGNTIIIHDATVPVEEGDVVEQQLPSGLTQRFRVVDRGYHGAFMDFPAGYDMKVRKL